MGAIFLSPQAAKIKAGLVVCSGAIFKYMSMTDSGVINSGHEPNSVQSLLQCPFERRTLAEKLKVKELGPDGLIYCEVLFVELCADPPQKNFTSRHWEQVYHVRKSNKYRRNIGYVMQHYKCICL